MNNEITFGTLTENGELVEIRKLSQQTIANCPYTVESFVESILEDQRISFVDAIA